MPIRNRTIIVMSLGLFIGGVMLGSAIPRVAAQTPPCSPEGAWEIRSGRPAEGHNWYAVRFNRCTGETWVLSAEGTLADDKWIALPFDKGAAR
jgi:hypothetical protein